MWDVAADPIKLRWQTPWRKHRRKDYAIDFTWSPTGRALLVSERTELETRRVDDGALIWTTRVPDDLWPYPLRYLDIAAVSDDGTRAVALGRESALYILDRAGSGETAPPQVRYFPYSDRFARTPTLLADGKTLVTLGHTVRVWDLSHDPTHPVRWSPEENGLRVVSSDYRLVAEYRPGSPDPKNTNVAGGAVVVRDVASGLEIGHIDPPSEFEPIPPVRGGARYPEWHSASFGADGRLLMSFRKIPPPGPPPKKAARPQELKYAVYDTNGFRPLSSWDASRPGSIWPGSDLGSYDWCGRWLLDQHHFKRTVRDPRTGAVISELSHTPGTQLEPYLIADPSGDRLAVSTLREEASQPDAGRGKADPAARIGKTGSVVMRLVELPTGREVWFRPEVDRFFALTARNTSIDAVGPPFFSPDGQRLAVRYSVAPEGARRIWVGRAADGETVRTLELPVAEEGRKAGRDQSPLSFSPDGRRLAATRGGEVFLWDLETGGLLWRLPGQGSQVRWATFTRDGSRLITSTFDWSGGLRTRPERLCVWDLVLGRELISVPIPGSSSWLMTGEKLSMRSGDGVWVFDGTPVKE